MEYIELINNLIKEVDPSLVDFSEERKHVTPPTQVSSEFLTNKAQGDWAEKTLLEGINKNSTKYIAVKYGRDDDIVAGECDFKKFYEEYQKELDEIGKRPDILIFDKTDFHYKDIDISKFSSEQLEKLVPLAKCGIEVRSSSFLIDKYESCMADRNNQLIDEALNIKEIILNEYSSLLMSKDLELYKIIKLFTPENIHILSYRTPSWKSTKELKMLSILLKNLKSIVKQISKRTFLSITPKIEDIKVVYNWIKKYNIPHFYVQVFFDKAYGIPFEKILKLISNPSLEGKDYFIEGDVKNQNKITIKIRANNEINVLKRIELPEHYSQMKELGRGRLLYYVKFKDSLSVINGKECEKLFGFKLI